MRNKIGSIGARLALAMAVVSPGYLPAASVSVVSISLDQNIEAPRWMFDKGAPVKGGPLIAAMVSAKQAQGERDRAKCLARLEDAYKLGKSLGPWIILNQIQCAQMRDKQGRVAVPALAQALARLDGQPRWLLFGPHVSALRQAYTSSLLLLAEAQTKTDRRSAWATLDKLQQVRSWLTTDERANTYRWAGELAFIEQNLVSAQDFLLRSLGERESSELRARVESIRSTLLGKKVAPATAPPSKAAEDLGISDEEKELYTRMNRAYEAQDYVSAVEDGVNLLRAYPGSRRAGDVSEKILDVYLTLSNRTEEKFRHVRESVVREMLKGDGERMARWANNAYARGNYVDALNLAEASYQKLIGQPASTKVLLLAGEAAVACGEYGDAVDHFGTLLKQHGGTPEAAEATFRMGLLDMRRQRYPQAAASFERLLALSAGREYEYRSLYWQWRAQQKIDAAKSVAFAAPLIAKFPLSYYALRAKAELNGKVVQLEKKPLVIKADLRMLETERLAWERLSILLKAGWFKESEKELDILPEPQSNEEKILRARYWAAALRYDMAAQLMNAVFEENPELMQASLLKIVFPDEYLPWIAREAKNSGVSPRWILSLIRQESSFRPELRSSADARGVMQILPATAQELARDFKMKDFNLESLLNPEINIKLGSAYFARLVKSYKGNIALALAAYNAGTGRVRRWLGARKDVNPLDGANTSSPDVEIWIDELPWDETSFYVKAVLRNWMIYELLDDSKFTLQDPVWKEAK